MNCIDKNGIAERVVRSVIGQARQIKQCMVFDDALGKSVTVQYVGVTEKRDAQLEAIRIVKAFHEGGYEDYRVRLFVMNMDGKNVGSLEVDASARTFGFSVAGSKWVGAALPMEENPTPEPEPLEYIDESIEISLEKMDKLVHGIQRISDVFRRKFYGVPKLPHEPSDNLTRHQFNRKPKAKGADDAE